MFDNIVQFSKALLSILFNVAGKDIAFNFLQLEKA